MIQVADLDTMDRAALLAAWSTLFGSPAPKGISQSFLRRFIAVEIQIRRSGGVPKTVMAALRKTEGGAASKTSSATLKAGGRLLREWNGVTHVVEITGTGFLWNGQAHRSLSAIAREITGAHWSGPRFFGLNGKVKR